MKIVMVSSVPAFPTTAGNRSRIRELARAVCELGHELTFVELPVSRADLGDSAAHKAAYGNKNYVCLENGGWFRDRAYRFRQVLRRILRRGLPALGIDVGRYHRLDENFHAPWMQQLAEIGRGADAVIVEYVFNSKAFEAFPEHARRLLDTHDAFADRHRTFLAQGMKTGYWVSLPVAEESRGFRRADAILAIQQKEASWFEAQLDKDGAGAEQPEIQIVSHFIDTSDPVTDFSTGDTALFLASNNPSNRQAIGDFIENVLPRIVAEIPDFQLKLVGSICEAAPDGPNIAKLGRVEALRDAFLQAPLAVNPMLVGTGINIKLLDAMAMGVATVSTETGLRGLPSAYQSGVVAIRDRDYDRFASEIVELARDETRRRAMGRTAYGNATRWNMEQKAALAQCLTGTLANAGTLPEERQRV